MPSGQEPLFMLHRVDLVGYHCQIERMIIGCKKSKGIHDQQSQNLSNRRTHPQLDLLPNTFAILWLFASQLPVHCLVLATIPKVSVSGIEGGIDTSEVPATSLEVKTGEVSSPEGTGSDITPGPSSTAKRKLEEPGKSEKKKKKMEEEDLSLRMVLAQEQTNSILKEISNSLKEIVNLKRGEQQFSVFEQ
ncbi:hypothetical protein MAR_027765 [Mya arenaria]|uniref:Uncharacterized protein n=1 Tax=Mya arenaria TaxID=6604 RepID=A0ABY7EWD3_MYAAR|nr:hypothetical protein MAR_027765 [Mya arenaria]